MKSHFKADEVIAGRVYAPGTMMKSSDLYHISSASTIRMERSSGLEMSTLTFTYGLHMRGNAAFRSRIAMKMFEFRQVMASKLSHFDCWIAYICTSFLIVIMCALWLATNAVNNTCFCTIDQVCRCAPSHG